MSSIMRENWIECSLGELSIFELGGDWGKSSDFEDENFVESYCIRGSEFRNWSEEKGRTASLRKIKKTSIEKRNLRINDILIEISGGGPEQPVGRTEIIDKSVLINFKGSYVVCTNFLRILRPSNFTYPYFLNLYLKYFYSTGEIIRYQAGSNNLRNLKFKDYLTIKVPLPPLVEQKAIVKKIEALFSSLDSGIADLKKAQDQLVIYRQAVLKKAFEGELTKEWRDKQSSLPSADDLLEQIKVERKKHYEQQLAEWKEAVKLWEKNGKEYRKPIRPVKLIDIDVDLNNQFGSSNWLMIEMGIVAELIDPQPSHRTPPVEENGIPFISTANFNKENGEIDFNSARKVSKEVLNDQISLFKLIEGDFIIGKIGTVGKPFVIPSKRFFTLSANLVLVQTNRKICCSKYLLHLIKSNFIQGQFRAGTNSTTQGAFGIKKFRVLRIPIPSLKEQNQIVKEIESRLSVCDKVEESIKESLIKAQALRQSILKKAFEGRLLSEAEIAMCKADKDYEPASVLLARIKAEKKNGSTKK